uniref:BZIP domain-containing protein n=1 Tax=Monopterus albus TaxID=43700 RepID=A0A3Q3KCG1_MONAL
MSPLFMDTSYESNSSGSLSEGKGQHLGNMGTKRREKNRDAARKSRRKQTERADELHEELQCIERSNSALKKEIAALKRDFNLYKTALERHEPYCCLRACASSSSSPTCLSVSLSADCQAGSSPPGYTDFLS